MAAQIANFVTHGELTVEQIAHIQKNILVSLRKDTFWDKFCSHTVVPEGQSSVEWRKLNIPDLKPSDIANLVEGITPAALQLEYVKFVVSPVDYGSWIGYTDKSKKYNYDDVVADAKTVLAQRARDEAEIRKAQQFISGTCTMSITSGDKKFLGDALRARTYLKKNHIKPISGNKYGCIMAPEHGAKVLLDYAAEITHTSQKESIIDGYLGELGGFMLFENADEVMYQRLEAAEAVTGVYKFTLSGTYAAGDTIKIDGVTTTLSEGEDTAAEAATAIVADASSFTNYTPTCSGAVLTLTEKSGKEGKGKPVIEFSNSAAVATFTAYGEGGSTLGKAAVSEATNSYVLFFGKTEYGMPVQTVAFGDANVKVFDNGLGSGVGKDASGNVQPDALHQRGSVAYKVMGFATRILADEAIIRGVYVIDGEHNDGDWKMNVADNNRKHYSAKSVSPNNN